MMLVIPRLPDDELLMQTIFTIAAAGRWDVTADLDVESIEHVPLVTWNLSDGVTGNSPYVWSVTLTVNIFETDVDAWPTVRAVDYAIQAWNTPGIGNLVDEGGKFVLGVDQVEYISKPSRVLSGVAMIGKTVSHYAAAYTLTLKSAPSPV